MQVVRHLSKLFSNMHSLTFRKIDEAGGDEASNMSKTAVGMWSGEKEYVEFTQPVELTGPVEDWLNLLMRTSRATLKDILTSAVVSYEEKPREQWLLEYPAQLSLAGVQIWWTTEVGLAFERLEEGHEMVHIQKSHSSSLFSSLCFFYY